MTKKYWNHNFRFCIESEAAARAWNILHSEEVKQDFKSQNEFVIQAINDFYKRYLAVKSDPYLENREQEEAFTDRMVKAVEQKILANIPALVGMYVMAGQASFLSVNTETAFSGTETVHMVSMPGNEVISFEEANEPEENELLDLDLFE